MINLVEGALLFYVFWKGVENVETDIITTAVAINTPRETETKGTNKVLLEYTITKTLQHLLKFVAILGLTKI